MSIGEKEKKKVKDASTSQAPQSTSMLQEIQVKDAIVPKLHKLVL